MSYASGMRIEPPTSGKPLRDRKAAGMQACLVAVTPL
jgi:hypothetical protein